jgi:hypothetical protein
MSVISNSLWRKGLVLAVIISIAAVWAACRPDSGAPTGLGAKANPDFVVAPSAANANTLYLVNKSSIASIPYWNVSWTVGSTNVNQKFSKDSASLYFPFSGSYALNVTLLVAANGGLDSVTRTVNVTIAQNDPTACQHSVQGFIASCSQKVWQLAPVAYAEEVGPAENDGSYFGTGANEVTGDRICDFNDSYTFVFNAAGTFNFDNKGDFYADAYMGNGNNDCENNSVLSPAQLPWASGNFTYNVSSTGGSAGLGQLTVNGLGAHIGIAKVQGNGNADNTTAPSATSITYDILSMGHNTSGNYDSLILATTTTYGAWTYQLRSND